MPSKLKSRIYLRADVFWDGMPCGLVYGIIVAAPITATDKPPLNLP